MSSPYVIIAAVHEPENSLEEWWENNRSSLDSFEKECYGDDVDWRLCEGTFKSTNAKETFPIKTAYHSGRSEDVVEIILSGKKNIQDVQMTGLEEIIEEINYRMDPDFTLEVYYWYNGVDKSGGK